MDSHRQFVSVLLLITLCHKCLSMGMFENVALNKTCKMSSQQSSSPGCEGAVNGNTDGRYRPGGTNCIHTNGSIFTSWWEVNLGRPYPVHNITVWARDDNPNHLFRMKGIEITVDGKECYKFDSSPSERQIAINCASGVLSGTVIRLYKNATAAGIQRPNHTINICEFQVFSCTDDYWGNDCSEKCGNCSNSEVCDKVTGHCSSCSPGLKPPLCSEGCDDNYWGIDCSEKCGNCNNSEVCDKVTGHCSSCSSGLKPPLCRAAEKAELREAGDASKTWIAVGASLGGVALLAIIVAVVVVCVRCQRARPETPTDPGEVPRKRDTTAAKSERQVTMHHSQTKQSEEADDCSVIIPGSIYDQLHTSPDTGDQHLYSDLQTVPAFKIETQKK